MAKSTQITIRVQPELLALLEARAQEERRTLAAMVKVILEDATAAAGKAARVRADTVS